MHRRLSIILICLAGFVLTLHNITPHVHDDPVTRENSSDPESLLEWLYFAFQIDPGAGHLECFSKPDQLSAHGDFVSFDVSGQMSSSNWVTSGAYYIE